MKNGALILDLDDTIFQTKSIDEKKLDPFFKNLFNEIATLYSEKKLDTIYSDLWKFSWDFVVQKHKIPIEIFTKSITILEQISSDIEIKPYSDYHFIKNYPEDKFLVTSGITILQKAKIKALNIENDFNKIIINDRFIESKTKYDIFQEIVNNYNLNPKKTFVVGDNPNSEIDAGNRLNLVTIQILRENIEKGSNAKYYIKSFEELNNFIK